MKILNENTPRKKHESSDPATEKIRELQCDKCGGTMKKIKKSLGGLGFFIIIIGFLMFFLGNPLTSSLGIIAMIIGLVVGTKVDYFWACRKCGYKFVSEK